MVDCTGGVIGLLFHKRRETKERMEATRQTLVRRGLISGKLTHGMKKCPAGHQIVEMRVPVTLASVTRGPCLHAVLVWLPFLILVMVVDPSAGSAQPKKEPLIRSRLVAIGEKSGNGIVVGECRFAVNESTVILDILEKRIELRDLPIPCEAEVQYRLRTNEDPLCVKITVKRLLEGSSEVRPSPGSD